MEKKKKNQPLLSHHSPQHRQSFLNDTMSWSNFSPTAVASSSSLSLFFLRSSCLCILLFIYLLLLLFFFYVSLFCDSHPPPFLGFWHDFSCNSIWLPTYIWKWNDWYIPWRVFFFFFLPFWNKAEKSIMHERQHMRACKSHCWIIFSAILFLLFFFFFF